jgi:hypothetical protein
VCGYAVCERTHHRNHGDGRSRRSPSHLGAYEGGTSDGEDAWNKAGFASSHYQASADCWQYRERTRAAREVSAVDLRCSPTGSISDKGDGHPSRRRWIPHDDGGSRSAWWSMVTHSGSAGAAIGVVGSCRRNDQWLPRTLSRIG